MFIHFARDLTMGLFDAYDPNTYQSPQGGLLDTKARFTHQGVKLFTENETGNAEVTL
jgi:hypothetical protein